MTTTPAASPANPSDNLPWYKLMNRGHWVVFIFASLAWLFDCLDQQLFNLARDSAMRDLFSGVGDAAAITAKATEFGPYTTSCFLVGWAIGGLIFGALGDRFGRARILTVSVLLYSLFTALCAFAWSYPIFCIGIALTGLGVGGIFGLAVALVADSVPEKARPSATGILQSISSWGNIAAGAIGMGIGVLAFKGLLPFELKAWQAMFLVGAVPALICVFFLARMKEPEKWVKAKADGEKRGIKFGSYSNLLRNPRWRKHAWLGLLLCSAGIIGLWGIGNFNPTIVGDVVLKYYTAHGLSGAELAGKQDTWRGLGLLLQNVGGFLGMITLVKIAQSKGRKFAFALALTLSFLSTNLVFYFLRDLSDMYWMLPIMGFGQYSVFAVYAIYLPEIFPTSLRSTGTSFCYNFGRLAAATAPFTIGQITRHLRATSPDPVEAFRIGGMCVSVILLFGLIALPFLPETKGQPLPEE